MLHVPVGANSFGLTTPSWNTTRPSSTGFGTTITPSTSGYGSYAQLGSDLTADAFGILICINNNYVSASSRNTVLKIGIDESGGTSYTDRIVDLLCGNAVSYGTVGVWYYFPLFIPAGSAVAAAAYSTVTTTFSVAAVFMQKPPNPSLIRKGSFVDTFGVTARAGTTITPGTTSEGAWVQVGTTADRCWWWQLGLQVTSGDTSWNNAAIHVDLACGDATNKDIIIQDLAIATSTSEYTINPPLTSGVEWDVPPGTNIYMRAQSSGTLDSYTVAAYGLGG